jgi:hypothetical protein
LQPCIAEVYHEEAQEFVNDLFYEKKRTVSVVQKEVSSFFNKKHCKLMQTRYLKKLLSPKCMIEKSQYFVSVLESSYVLSECEESSSEDEIFLGDLVDDSVAKKAGSKKPRAVAHKRSVKKQTTEAMKQPATKKPRVSLDYLDNYNAKEEEERHQKFAEKMAELDYLSNYNSDEDETRVEYEERIGKRRAVSDVSESDDCDCKPAAKIDYQNLSVCSTSSDKDENEFTCSFGAAN